jgi:hypothetical protein
VRQLQTFGPGVSSAPLMQCRRLDHAAFPRNELGTASTTGISPTARTCQFSTRSLDNRAQKQCLEKSPPLSSSASMEPRALAENEGYLSLRRNGLRTKIAS